MNTISNFTKKYGLLLFLITMPLLSNALAFGLHLPVEIVALVGAAVPAILAILLVGMGNGRTGLKLLLRKPFQWRVSIIWYIIALILLPLVLQLSVNLLGFALGSGVAAYLSLAPLDPCAF